MIVDSAAIVAVLDTYLSLYLYSNKLVIYAAIAYYANFKYDYLKRTE